MVQTLCVPALAEKGLAETCLELGIVRDEFLRCLERLESGVELTLQEQ